MTATTKRATATALPKAKPSADTVASNAPDPKSALSEDYSELLVAQAVADTRLAMADAKRRRRIKPPQTLLRSKRISAYRRADYSPAPTTLG
jgi:hypothetical protein